MARHLFNVHSPITYFMALEVIRIEKIPVEAVTLLISRNFLPPDGTYQAIPMPFSHYPIDSFAVQIAFWKSWNKVRAFDQWLETITQQQPFTLYAAHAYSSIFHLMVTHPMCQGYYYIEEGLVAYRPPADWDIQKPFNPLRSVLYYLNFGQRNRPNRSFFTTQLGRYLGAFGVSQHSFPTLPNLQAVGLPFPKIESGEKYQCVIVHDNIYDHHGLTPSTYLRWIEVIVNDALKRGFNSIHQKFHPAQEQASLQAIEAFMQQKVAGKASLHTLGASDSIEQISLSQHPVIYVCISSVGLYAHLAGSEVVSIYKICCQDQPIFKSFGHLLPSFYLENVTYLQYPSQN